MSSSSPPPPPLSRSTIRRMVMVRMGGGLAFMAIPVCGWWYWAYNERAKTVKEVQTKIRIPNVEDSYDLLIAERCQAGDVVLFDRRCELCAAGPWAAMACAAAKKFLPLRNTTRSVDSGNYDHIGLIVPGFVRTKADLYDPTNLLLLEMTSGEGVVARPLKERLEVSGSRTVLLVPLCGPGEDRQNFNTSYQDDDKGSYERRKRLQEQRQGKGVLSEEQQKAADEQKSSRELMVQRTRDYVEKRLIQFRDDSLARSKSSGYRWVHSTLTFGGAVLYGLGLYEFLRPVLGTTYCVSPSAYFCLQGLKQAAVAENVLQAEASRVKPDDVLRDYRFHDANAVRLRPGWRFLAPLPLKEVGRS